MCGNVSPLQIVYAKMKRTDAAKQRSSFVSKLESEGYRFMMKATSIPKAIIKDKASNVDMGNHLPCGEGRPLESLSLINHYYSRTAGLLHPALFFVLIYIYCFNA